MIQVLIDKTFLVLDFNIQGWLATEVQSSDLWQLSQWGELIFLTSFKFRIYWEAVQQVCLSSLVH